MDIILHFNVPFEKRHKELQEALIHPFHIIRDAQTVLAFGLEPRSLNFELAQLMTTPISQVNDAYGLICAYLSSGNLHTAKGRLVPASRDYKQGLAHMAYCAVRLKDLVLADYAMARRLMKCHYALLCNYALLKVKQDKFTGALKLLHVAFNIQGTSIDEKAIGYYCRGLAMATGGYDHVAMYEFSFALLLCPGHEAVIGEVAALEARLKKTTNGSATQAFERVFEPCGKESYRSLLWTDEQDNDMKLTYEDMFKSMAESGQYIRPIFQFNHLT